MERAKQQDNESNSGGWAEKQETAYWQEVNKSRDERMAQIHLKGLSTKGLVNAIATASGYTGKNIYLDIEVQALDVEASINQFIKEVENLNASL
jgi:hypothetical protein